MSRILCFVVEEKNLFLEQVLVDFNGCPIFYICKGDNEYQFVLCADIDIMEYYIVPTNLNEISKLFAQKITMRDVFERKTYFWHVISGETIEQDDVYKKDISEIEPSVLPIEGAYFEMFTEEIKQYSSHINQLLCEPSSFSLLTSFPVENGSVNDESDNTSIAVDRYIEILPFGGEINMQIINSSTFSYDQQTFFDGYELIISLNTKADRVFDVSTENINLHMSAA